MEDDRHYGPNDYIPFEEVELAGDAGCTRLRLKRVRAGFVLEHSVQPLRGVTQTLKACFPNLADLKRYCAEPEFAASTALVAGLISRVAGRAL